MLFFIEFAVYKVAFHQNPIAFYPSLILDRNYWSEVPGIPGFCNHRVKSVGQARPGQSLITSLFKQHYYAGYQHLKRFGVAWIWIAYCNYYYYVMEVYGNYTCIRLDIRQPLYSPWRHEVFLNHVQFKPRTYQNCVG